MDLLDSKVKMEIQMNKNVRTSFFMFQKNMRIMQ